MTRHKGPEKGSNTIQSMGISDSMHLPVPIEMNLM